MSPSTRDVTAAITLEITGPAEIILSVAVGRSAEPQTEALTITVDGTPVESISEVEMADGTRLHHLTNVPSGTLRLDYSASVPQTTTDGAPVSDIERIVYTRPSRYCDSDRLAAVANTHFGELTGRELVHTIGSWVHNQVAYVPGSTDVTDGALEAYLSRQGVCRDMAQLVVTFCRARNIPARLVSVYAPGLDPMDFHAVAEVEIDGVWEIIDATRLAPRASFVRIATGRDAADTAFMTTLAGRVQLDRMEVTATVSPELPAEDPDATIHLA
ncbi:MAG: transglutaminase family protein [Actinomycetia bacterium]|nr:transglutaminase family protein [Actinomycetes bacterium]